MAQTIWNIKTTMVSTQTWEDVCITLEKVSDTMVVTSDSLEFFHDIIYFANIESITNQSYVLQYPVFKVNFKKVSRSEK